LFLKVIGIVFFLIGLKGYSITKGNKDKKNKDKKNRLRGRSVPFLKNGYIFLTGCFFFTVPYLDIKLHQLFLLGALYAGLSTIFWIYVHLLEKDKEV
jgi:hypothetical protein